jgi:hypothetical protein
MTDEPMGTLDGKELPVGVAICMLAVPVSNTAPPTIEPVASPEIVTVVLSTVFWHTGYPAMLAGPT